MVDLALMTEPQMGGTYDDLLAAARLCEEAGLVAFARSDHYLWPGSDSPVEATDAFATLAGLARETETVRLCVLVSPITFRHPAVIAKMAATIDQMSGGRLDLGVGTGWMEEEHEAFGLPFPETKERFDRLEEALRYLRAAFGESDDGFSGRYYRLEDVTVKPRPVQRPFPLIVGGTGPHRTPTLAGTYASEYNHVIRKPEELSPKLERARAAASEAGRDPGALVFSVMGPVVAGPDQSSYRRILERQAAARDRTPEEQEARLAEVGVPHGPPEQISETMAALEEAGVEKYYVQFLDVSDRETIETTLEALIR